METWKKVEGFDRYEISSEGRLRTIFAAAGGGHKPGVRKPNIGKNGYVRYSLCKNSKYTHCLAHRLVAEAFIPKVDGKEWVNHKNFDKADNRIENLEWCTPTENNHATDRAGKRHASTNPNRAHKLTLEKAIRIRELAGQGVRTGLIASEFGVSGTVVRKIVRGLLWASPPQ